MHRYRGKAVPWDDRYWELAWVRDRWIKTMRTDLAQWWIEEVPFYLRQRAKKK
ncbi:MAG: hypothetical protein ACRCYP_03755 [Alphaproteobacteria bacterium]